MYAVFFGCSKEDAERMVLPELRASKDSIFSPFTMIKLFLEKEAKNRIREVDKAIHALQTVISNFEFQAKTSGLGASKGKEQDPKQMITLYLNVGSLKNGLVEWRSQLSRMLECCDEFRAMPSAGNDIDPVVYIQRIIDDYDTRVLDCETVMEGASLTFQMETAFQAKQDTEIAINDGKAMKTMAVVTMLFLPGTFFAVSAIHDT
ncbi:hypothetical protein VM1G_02931 [Cytospora mali]|uniref:Uncharacterized protein n=1 Tax=Cytospora mali TaxID=578113 RepID=A0A194VUU0_CYTMA|nr:hypothetical protein VM1G_02931 [Valsa mali]